MVPLEHRLLDERVNDRQAGRGAGGHADRDGPVQLDDRRPGQQLVQRGDARPIGVLGPDGAGVAGGDGGLDRVRATAQRLGLLQCGQAAADQ